MVYLNPPSNLPNFSDTYHSFGFGKCPCTVSSFRAITQSEGDHTEQGFDFYVKLPWDALYARDFDFHFHMIEHPFYIMIYHEIWHEQKPPTI